MRITKILLGLSLALALLVTSGGCSSSKDDDKQPKVKGGKVDPNLKPLGREAGGGAGGQPAGGAKSQVPVTKD